MPWAGDSHSLRFFPSLLTLMIAFLTLNKCYLLSTKCPSSIGGSYKLQNILLLLAMLFLKKSHSSFDAEDPIHPSPGPLGLA